MNIVTIGRHEGLLRDVSRGCAYGDPTSLSQGAAILSAFIRDNSIIIPMPSHIGYATTMKELCRYITDINDTVEMVDCLRCIPHQSNHIQKLHGEDPAQVIMFTSMNTEEIKKKYKDKKLYIIDNYIGTGATAMAALRVLDATVIAITKG